MCLSVYNPICVSLGPKVYGCVLVSVKYTIIKIHRFIPWLNKRYPYISIKETSQGSLLYEQEFPLNVLGEITKQAQ